MFRRSVSGAALAGACIASFLFAAPPAQAAPSGAAACTSANWRPLDGSVTYPKSSAPVLHQAGPYGDCTPGYTLSGQTKLVYDCTTTNLYGHRWTHVTAYYGSQVLKGWIYNNSLPFESQWECPR